jgi:putative cardiolipin synthase
MLAGLARQGVKVRMLTNSLASNDVEPVHGHYARYRKDLLSACVELWELRPDKPRPGPETLGLGRSQSGLHGKAFAVDRRYLFIGSFKWDPRSVNINTELGIPLDAPDLTQAALSTFNSRLARLAYRLRLDEDGEIEWRRCRTATG